MILNGDFENSTAINTTLNPTSVGGIGQLVEVVNLPNWTRTITKDPTSGGFAFVINSQADFKNGNLYPNQGGGFPTKFTAPFSANMFVWGPNYSPDPQANGFTGSPSGGKFMGIDGDFGRSKISQTVTGLDTTKVYTLSFEYAGSQLIDASGATNQYWEVGINGAVFSQTTSFVNPGKGFTPWQTYTTTFTPTTSSLNLSFEAFGSDASGGGASLPPFLLMDNVRLFEGGGGGGGGGSDPAPGPLPAAGLAAAFAWSRRLRRRIQG